MGGVGTRTMTHKPTHANNSSLWRLTSFDTQGQQIDTQRDNDTRIVPGKKASG